MITKPKLPPKPGHVEVEVNGVRQYKKIEPDQEQTTEARVAELEEALELLLSGATGEEVPADEA